ncbi:nucleotidyltransferase domain-containing protein [Paenibacillus eucommiae]|uniref:DUF4111 domain-containing protein n=1 Tax=Paenibacillus eucommiae TaxID=1355755 RepID=A0ABS4J2P1_9BACL|nr:nucleotidyltransferase domain-containing protein [Paenibacillus eucommiae]MBP1994100.1 hypothetical protein [Paenibacillus eucommiae]
MELLPDKVSITMRKLCNLLESSLQGRLKAVYVYGSTALGDYIEGSSDIDFIAVVEQPLSPVHIQAIIEAHEEVERILPGTDIMGAYLGQEDLGKAFNEIPFVLTYFNKQVHEDGTGTDINPVTWWVLKHHGIRAYGLNISFSYEISKETLIDYVMANMNSYWKNWVERLERRLREPDLSEQTIKAAELDYAVEWCVLGMLRQLYTIKEHGVTSKTGAGTYGMNLLSDRWHGLIREAIAIKRCQVERVYDSQVKRLNDLVELLSYIHTESNRCFLKNEESE